METWIITLNDMSAPWCGAMWRACWQGTLVLLLVFGVCRVFPRIPARFQSWLWRLAYLKLLLAFLWAGIIPLAILPKRPSQPAHAIHILNSPSEHRVSINTPSPTSSSIRHASETGLDTQPVSPVARQTSLNARTRLPRVALPSYLLLLWLIGITWGGYRLFHAWKHVLHLRDTAQPVIDASDAHAALADTCMAFRLRHVPTLMTGQVDTPVLVGGAKPCILLPQSFLDLDSASLRLMLAHEVAHHKRYDLLWGWLPVVVEVIFFFHPLVWLLRREARLAQEMACDALAIRMLSTPATEYGTMLLNLIQGMPSRKIDVFSMGIRESGQQLKRRIVALRWATVSKRLLFTSIGLLAFFLLCLLPWQFVTRGATAFAAAFADPQVSLTFTPLTLQDTGFYRFNSPTPVISPDGQRVYFITDKYWAQDGKSFPANEILLYQRATGNIMDTGLPMANIEARFDRFGHQAHDAVFSADGRYVVYASKSPEHVTTEGNGQIHIYRKDLQTGAIVDITRTIDGLPPDGPSDHPAISGDGNVVAFLSYARNLSDYRFNKPAQSFPAREGFYRRDINKGQTEFIPVPGVSGNLMSNPYEISDLRLDADGNVVTFTGQFSIVKKSASAIETTSWQEPMAYDCQTKKVFHIGIKIGDHQLGIEPHVSANGRFIVFHTQADKSACYLYDMQRHAVEQIGDRSVIGNPVISGDGRYITFASRTHDPAVTGNQGKGLVERNAPSEIYLFDRETKKTECLSNGNAAIRQDLGLDYYDNLTPSISTDGRYICYAAHLADRSFQYMSSNPNTNSLLHSAWAILVYDHASGNTTTPIIATSWQATPVVVTPAPAEPVPVEVTVAGKRLRIAIPKDQMFVQFTDVQNGKLLATVMDNGGILRPGMVYAVSGDMLVVSHRRANMVSGVSLRELLLHPSADPERPSKNYTWSSAMSNNIEHMLTLKDGSILITLAATWPHATPQQTPQPFSALTRIDAKTGKTIWAQTLVPGDNTGMFLPLQGVCEYGDTIYTASLRPGGAGSADDAIGVIKQQYPGIDPAKFHYYLFALDKDTGAVRWKYPTDGTLGIISVDAKSVTLETDPDLLRLSEGKLHKQRIDVDRLTGKAMENTKVK